MKHLEIYDKRSRLKSLISSCSMVIKPKLRFLGALIAEPLTLTSFNYARNYKGSADFHTVPVGSREEFNRDSPFVGNAPNRDGFPTLMTYKNNIVYLKSIDRTLQALSYFARKYAV